MDPADIEDLFDQLEDFSDSGPDVDNISIGSTPKPHLKPFFTSSRNLLNEAACRGISAVTSNSAIGSGGDQTSQSKNNFLRLFRIFRAGREMTKNTKNILRLDIFSKKARIVQLQ